MGLSSDKLSKYMQTPEGQKAFLDWVAGGFTQLMLASARELARPRAPAAADAIAIVHQSGESVGANAILDFLESPWLSGQLGATSGAKSLVADYGARDIINAGEETADASSSR